MPVCSFAYLQVAHVLIDDALRLHSESRKMPVPVNEPAGFFLSRAARLRALAVRALHLREHCTTTPDSLMQIPRFGSSDNKDPHAQFQRWLKQLVERVGEDGGEPVIEASPEADSDLFKLLADQGVIRSVSIRILGAGPQGEGVGEGMELVAGGALDMGAPSGTANANFSAVGPRENPSWWGKAGELDALSGEQLAARCALAGAGGLAAAASAPADAKWLAGLKSESALLWHELCELLKRVDERTANVPALEAAARAFVAASNGGDGGGGGGGAGGGAAAGAMPAAPPAASPAAAPAVAPPPSLSVLAALFACVGEHLVAKRADRAFLSRALPVATEAQLATRKTALVAALRKLGAYVAEKLA